MSSDTASDDDERTRQDSTRSTGSTGSTGSKGAPLRLNPPPGLMMRMSHLSEEGAPTAAPDRGGEGGGGGGGGGHDDFNTMARTSSGSSALNLMDRQQSGGSLTLERNLSGSTDGGMPGFAASVGFTNLENWTEQNVEEWLMSVGLKNVAKTFVEHGIDGYLLERLTETDLDQELNIASNLQRVKIFRAINNLKRMSTSAAAAASSHSHDHGHGHGAGAGGSGSGGGGSGGGGGGGKLVLHGGGRGGAQFDSRETRPSHDTAFRDSWKHSNSTSVATSGTGTDVETDVSWLQYVEYHSRFTALVGWLLQKVVDVMEAHHENPGLALNGYTNAALGALATISHSMMPRSQMWGGTSRSSMRSYSQVHLSRGNNSSNSTGSRGSGAAAHFRLREVLESTPGWDMENMTFLSQPDVPWLHMRLVDLNEELKVQSEQVKAEAKTNAAHVAAAAASAAHVGSEMMMSEDTDKAAPPPPSIAGPPPASLRLGKNFHSGPLPTLSPMHDGTPSSPFSPSLIAPAAMDEGVAVLRGGSNKPSLLGGRSGRSGGSGGSGSGSGGRSGGSGSGSGGRSGVSGSGSGGSGGGDSGEDCEADAVDQGGFEKDMRQALEAATAARNLVADRYGMSKETAAVAIGHMATMVSMDEKEAQAQASAGQQLAAVEEAVEAAEMQRFAAVELEEAEAAAAAGGGPDEQVSAANAAATATHAEIVQMQDAVMHQQKASMQEMHMAACERESVAMQEFEMATSAVGKSEAKALVQKAVMQQQELAVQEMQQSVMQQQQELATEVMQQQRQDAAEQNVLNKTQESMQVAMMTRQDAVKHAVHLHDEAMEEVMHHQDQLEAAMNDGDSEKIAEEKKEYKSAVERQKGAMKNVKFVQQSMESTMTQQHTLQKALSMQKQMQDVQKAQRAKGVEKSQMDIQLKQSEVMKQAAAIQAAIPDTPEGRDMSAIEAARGYQGVEKRAVGSGSVPSTEAGTSDTSSLPSSSADPISGSESGLSSRGVVAGGGVASGGATMFSRGKVSEHATPYVELSEEWEIDFSEIEFSPNGVPSSENRIGHGGFGEVFLGQLGGMHVAVKKLFNQEHAEQGMREFRAEVSILSKLRHPSIVLWLGACTKAPNCTIILEFMDRGSLNQLLHRSNTPYTLVTAIKWCISIARGMLYLHQHKPYPIIHCDLNSNNVLVNRDWAVKITDFGLSKVKRTSRLSRRSGITGTVNYAAPEVIRGAPPSEASDVYSFSLLVWEIFTRKVPWKDLTEYQIIYKMTASTKRDPKATATSESFIVPENLPDGTEKLLHECWTAMPTMRPLFPRLVDEFREMLRRESALAKQAKQNEEEPLKAETGGGGEQNKGGQAAEPKKTDYPEK